MGRIVRPVDFQRVLGTLPWARSAHFAVHHLPQAPSRPAFSTARSTELSTDQQQTCPLLVDEAAFVAAEAGAPAASPPALSTCWLGMVVPKRHAKRSVTRSLIKRQIRVAVQTVGDTPPSMAALRPGLWVVRLRAPIDRKRFPSAASEALRAAMHDELAQVMAKALQRCHG